MVDEIFPLIRGLHGWSQHQASRRSAALARIQLNKASEPSRVHGEHRDQCAGGSLHVSCMVPPGGGGSRAGTLPRTTIPVAAGVSSTMTQ